MTMINTIAGGVDIGDLGWTLSHEHLTNGAAGMENLPGLIDVPGRQQEMVDRCIEALKRARQYGVRSLIDLTPFDLGRQAWLFEEVAARHSEHDVNVICATGVYRWVPPIFFGWDIDEIADHFASEIVSGIAGSNIKAGIIKLAWDIEAHQTDGPGAPRIHLEKTARAAARAAKRTGVPISCHTKATDELGTPLLDIFEDEGLDLGAVTIGHSNDTSDMAYLKSIAQRGAVVGLDRFFSTEEQYVANRSRIALELASAGFADKVALGHDATPAGFWGTWKDEANLDVWTLVPAFEVAWLRNNGLPEDQLNEMMVNSIANTFTVAKSLSS